MLANRITLASAESAPDRDVLVPEVDLGGLIRDLVDKLLRHWVLLSGIVGAAILLAVLYVLTATPLYTANGSILIDPRMGQSPDTTRQISPSLLISDALTVDSELRVLTSREVTASVLEQFPRPEADEEPSGPSLRQRLDALLGAVGLGSEDPVFDDATLEARIAEARRREFVRNLRVARGGESFVIDIAYTAPDPVFAAESVNQLIQEYLRLSGADRIANVERNRTWLEGRIETLGTDVEAAETAVAEYRRVNDLLAPEGQLLPTEIALNAAVEELVRLRGEALAVEVQAEQLAEQIAAGDVDAVQLPPEDRSEALAGFEARYAELQQEERSLLLSWAEGSPIVENVRRQQVQTRDLILAEYRLALERIEATRDSLARRVAATETVIEDLREDYGENARRAVDLRSLEREADAKRELYEQLLEQYNSASQLLTFDATSARVIAWAVPPDQKSAPRSRQVVVLAAFAAVVLGIGAILLIEALDGTYRRQSEVTRDLGLGVVGTIPTFGSEKSGGGGAFGLMASASDRRRGPRWRRLSRQAKRLAFAADNPSSHAADTMQSLHTRLSRRLPDLTPKEGAGAVIGFTSSVLGEGKTMTAGNFATFLAARGERVAIIDLDLVTRNLSRLLAPILPPSNALSRFVADPAGAMEGLDGIPELPGLAVIGNASGRVPARVTPQRATGLGAVLEELRQHFDYVVVDLPPAMGTADTQLLAGLCDTLIYAVHWGKTPRDQVALSIRQRGLDRDKLFGVLFTRAPMRRYRSYNRYDLSEYYA